MPVTYNEDKKKWCYGDRCVYDTKEDANAAAAAIHMEKGNMSDIVIKTDIAKSFDEEKRLFTAVVLRPNQYDDDGENQDYYSEEVVEKACYDFNEYCGQGNISHYFNTDVVVPVESWVSKSDHALGSGEVKTGDWVMSMKIKDDSIWDMCKEGLFTGFSIGCSARVIVEDGDN